jgi:hypothetical protein
MPAQSRSPSYAPCVRRNFLSQEFAAGTGELRKRSVRAVLLPASMILLGDHNWYLPKCSRGLPASTTARQSRNPRPTAPPAYEPTAAWAKPAAETQLERSTPNQPNTSDEVIAFFDHALLDAR